MEGRAALWDFAVALYSSPDVEKTLLYLQDHFKVNVNLVLWACWLQKRHIALDQPLLQAAENAIAGWDNSVVQNLRQLRRQLKADAADDELIAQLREQIKSAELLAERQCLNLLADLAISPCQRNGEPDNLGFYLSHRVGNAEVAALRQALAMR